MNRETYSAYDLEGRRKYLTQEEGRRFLKIARRRKRAEALFCMTIYYTGMRISEALALSGQDIDFSTGVIRIRSLKKRERREFRRIPVPNSLLSGLRQLRGDRTEGPLWTFSRTTGWRIIKQIMNEAEISGIHATTKGLRHAFGVRGAIAKIPLNLLQLWFGHSQSATTAIYLNVRDDEERTLIRRTWK
ncbi:site-specific integrase [Phragmitibacter flavus]|uniref:Site-specific integrase n=1 Tax=Phragmitibacter flavus TaxID=2576071 RepID=A0A5R8KHL6_9BACT|nr:tyrosine-type recombinase/integrase [Phragmitibacter flavus]TLD71475.1 site-specific integrase [Phragmitibacter flavus]